MACSPVHFPVVFTTIGAVAFRLWSNRSGLVFMALLGGMAGSSLVGLPASGCNQLSAVDLCNASETTASGMGVRVLLWRGLV